MTAPKRWIEKGSGSTITERELLGSGVDMDPPPEAQDHVWGALLARIGAPPGGGDGGSLDGPAGPADGGAGATGAGLAGGGASGVSAVAQTAGLVKWALLGGASAGLLIGANEIATPTMPAPSSVVAQTSAETVAHQPPAPDRSSNFALESHPEAVIPSKSAKRRPPLAPSSGERPVAEPESAPMESAAPTAPATVPKPLSAVERANQLREESQLLRHVRDALLRGDSAGAMRHLQAVRERFPRGGLMQEREALTIEALFRSGNRSAAAQRAAVFLQAYPTSPHAARVRTFAGPADFNP